MDKIVINNNHLNTIEQSDFVAIWIQVIILIIGYIIKENKINNFIERIKLKIANFFNIVRICIENGKVLIYLPILEKSKVKDKKMVKIAKKLNQKLYNNNIENVVLSTTLQTNQILRQKLNCESINILNGRELFLLLIPEIIEYILKIQKKKLENRRSCITNKRFK